MKLTVTFMDFSSHVSYSPLSEIFPHNKFKTLTNIFFFWGFQSIYKLLFIKTTTTNDNES
jgi:hypothetical protein